MFDFIADFVPFSLFSGTFIGIFGECTLNQFDCIDFFGEHMCNQHSFVNWTAGNVIGGIKGNTSLSHKNIGLSSKFLNAFIIPAACGDNSEIVEIIFNILLFTKFFLLFFILYIINDI